MCQANRVTTNGADLFVGFTNSVPGVSTRRLVMLADALFTVRAVFDEGSTVGLLTLDARLCMGGTVYFTVVSASVPVIWAQCVLTGGAGLTVVRTESISTDVTLLGVVSADSCLTGGALDTVRWTSWLFTYLTRCEVVGAEWLGTEPTVAVMIAAQRVTTFRTVGRVIRTKHVTTSPARRGISITDAVVTCGTGHKMCIGKLIHTDNTG